jgi:GTP-binding protein EngB required for normal cell division
MLETPAKQAVDTAFERLLETVRRPRALLLRAADRVALEQAVARARAQFLDVPTPVLTVALAGGTGSGKSTLINALAGATIAEVGPLRPTTRQLRVYHHRDVAAGGLPVELANEATFAPHDRPSLYAKVLIDTPDLDSFATQHRALTRALLKAAGLVLYVFSPQNYRDERTWSVLREEQRFSACAAVLNKSDLVTPEELEAITADLQGAFARLGLPDLRIFRTVARAHVPGDDGLMPTPPAGADDLAALRSFLEHELRHSDIVRLRYRQQTRVFAHLQAEIDRVAPTHLLERFDTLTMHISERLESATARLQEALADELAVVRADLLPLLTLRQHERFRGPFRAWLAVTDVLRFGLPGLVRRLLEPVPEGQGSRIEPLLGRRRSTADDLLRAEAQGMQSLLYARGLPIEHWRTVTVQADGGRLLADIASTLKSRFEVAATTSTRRGGAIVWLVNALGAVVPAAFVLIGLYVMGRDLLVGHYIGLPLLGHLLAMLILTFLTLQGIAGLFLPSGRRWLAPDLERQAIAEVLNRTLHDWISAYRSDLEADLSELRAPLAALQSALTVPPTPEESALPFPLDSSRDVVPSPAGRGSG